MQQYFYKIADLIIQKISATETLLISLIAEDSTFIRLNNNLVRQAGTVKQSCLTLQLIQNQQHSSARCELTGEIGADLNSLGELLTRLRAQVKLLPADPYLHYATTVNNSEYIQSGNIPPINNILDIITQQAEALDLVGIWASGTQCQGFANSFGQKNWFSTENFNFDWSIYSQGNNAIKMNYAGKQWDVNTLSAKIDNCRQSMEILSADSICLGPGRYRVYLAPAALVELTDMLCWGGFDLKSHRTAQTPLIKMLTENKTLHEMVSITENQAMGIGPNFTEQGFIKPAQVSLISAGHYKDCLVDARSAKEYHNQVNSNTGNPNSVELSAGTIREAEILELLDTGIYINNLWYCNYSDRNHGRITGMTRYACYWVENGKVVAPINVMRFDDTIYNILGDQLLGLTKNRDFISDTSSYDFRSTSCSLVPGALVNEFTLTL